MAKTVVGLIESPDEAQVLVQELVNGGLDRSAISMMTSDRSHIAGMEGDAGDVATSALKGAGTGAALGGVAGLLAGLASLAIPGIGPIIAAGPIAAALAGAGIGAVAGGGIGAFTKMGVPEEDAPYYAEGIRRGGTLVTVSTDDDGLADQAADIMRSHGAVDIEERASEWKASGWSGDQAGTGRQSGQVAGVVEQEGEQVVPVVKEELQVGKRQVERGGVKIYTHVTETPVEETIQLREQHADVERRPVDRPLSAADEAAFKEQSIEVHETAEEAVVAKRGRVVEEVVISKEEVEREETIRDTLRETDVEIERIPGGMRSSYQGAERRMAIPSIRYKGVERRAM